MGGKHEETQIQGEKASTFNDVIAVSANANTESIISSGTSKKEKKRKKKKKLTIIS